LDAKEQDIAIGCRTLIYVDGSHLARDVLSDAVLAWNLLKPGGIPEVVNEGGFLTMTLTKRPGVSYEVQSAGTLLPALPDSFSAASTTVIINDATVLKVRDNFLIGAERGRFMRVKVTVAP